MLAALSFNPCVLRVLNLGVGAGTVERYFKATDASVELVSVERHAGVVDLAREYFHLTDSPVILASAEHSLHGSREHFDVVLCDLFERQQPADCLQSSVFIRQIANTLSPERGTAVFNLVSGDQQNLLNTLKRIREHLPWTRLATVGDRGNLVVFCRHARPMASDDQLEQSARTLLASDAFAPLPFAFNLLEVPDREDQGGPPGRERR
jgi:spermidine synthase